MVAEQNDDRVVGEAGPVQLVQHATDLRIDVTDAGEVGLADSLLVALGDRSLSRLICVTSQFSGTVARKPGSIDRELSV